MEATRSSGARSGNSGAYAPPEVAESLRFEEEMEIQSLIHPPAFDAPSATGKNSFTALLGLTSNQAVELLHHPESGDHHGAVATAAGSVAGGGGGEVWRLGLGDHEDALSLPLGCSPTFPSNAALVERAARLSVFANEESPASSSCGGGGNGRRSPKPKAEPPDSDGAPICAVPSDERPQQRPAKRKDGKVNKAPAKKSKSAEENAASPAAEESAGDDGKLPYVHVRARRGQATDSHSLAERARREKINARMKLLQELVPGCSKISGTALVLDEIINHVQSLQRQVEFLSMRLAAVNPRIDFPGLDSFLPPECGRMTRMALEPPPWPSSAEAAAAVNGERRQAQQQQQQQLLWHVDLLHPNLNSNQQEASTAAAWTRDDAHPNNIFINPGASSLFTYAPANPVPLHQNQLKREL